MDGTDFWPGESAAEAAAGARRASGERYAELGRLARGGMSSLHRVHDLALDRVLARKQVEGSEEGAHLLREARLTARLEHPGIVPVHDVGGEDSGRAWFTMKEVRGRTFDEVHAPGGDLRALVETLVRLCEAASYAHSQGVVHCDIKPANVMIGEFGEVYLMDWGIAVLDGEDGEGALGTPSWRAPEQARRAGVDKRTDVYGLGALLYHGLCGARVHPGATVAERTAHALNGHVVPPQIVRRGLPVELCRITMRALAPDPADRYPDAAALRAELTAALRGGWWLETRHWAAGSVVVEQGDAATAAWTIVEGEASVWLAGRQIRRLGPGEVFGEIALLAGELRTATVRADTDLVARVLSAEAFEAALDDVWLGPIARALARRVRELERG